MKPLTFQGNKFTSYRQAADYIGISAVGFSKRYQKYTAGEYTLDDLFSTTEHKLNSAKKSLTYKGKTFTYEQAAEYIGISIPTFYRRLKKYQANQIDLNQLFKSSNYHNYELPPYGNKIFESKTEAAKYVGITQTKFSKRLKQYKNGQYTINDLYSRSSTNLRAKSMKKVKLQYQGKTFNSYKAAYDYIGISSTAFRGRLKKYLTGEFTIEQLFRSPKHSQGHMLRYKHHTFYSYHEAADFIGISYSAFMKRLQKYKRHKITLFELFHKVN